MLRSVWPQLLVYWNSHFEDVDMFFCGVLRCTGVQRNGVAKRVCMQCRGGVCFCSWLPEKRAAHASAAALFRQWQHCLAFRARGQGGASHHLPTKAQVTQPASALPHFLPSPHSSPHPITGPAEKTQGFSPFFPCSSPRAPPPTPQLSWYSTFISLWKGPFLFLPRNFTSFFSSSVLCPHGLCFYLDKRMTAFVNKEQQSFI